MHECRICLEEDEKLNMISPCLCRGHMKYIHRDCLNQWRALSDQPNCDDTCPTCKFIYKFTTPRLIECHCFYKNLKYFMNMITGNLFIFLIFY